jgi:hypothetical protein
MAARHDPEMPGFARFATEPGDQHAPAARSRWDNGAFTVIRAMCTIA